MAGLKRVGRRRRRIVAAETAPFGRRNGAGAGASEGKVKKLPWRRRRRGGRNGRREGTEEHCG